MRIVGAMGKGKLGLGSSILMGRSERGLGFHWVSLDGLDLNSIISENYYSFYFKKINFNLIKL